MRNWIPLGARILLGLIYFVFGGMGLAMAAGLMTMPETPPMPEAATEFMSGMMATGYFFPLLKFTETAGGFFLLIGRGAPVALVILAPVTLHIFLFHACLTPGAGELVLPAAMVLLQVLAMSAYWPLYRPLFGPPRSA
ncbi:MAG: acyltransferase [Candidatus Omnitrophica bacterium]|nr:acyltransferase [Candidatus Omnitrophota bacterium]MCB9721921.1 acyltransferase [Candidatus Omnitrophota bacterium]